MSMPDSGRRSPTYTGTGQVREFAFNFKVFSKDQVKVYTQAAEGAPVEELASSNYSVTLQDTGGTVSLNTPLADQAKLVIVSAIPYDQEVSLENFGSFNPEDLNGAWDKNTALIQQLKERLDRAVVAPVLGDETAEEFTQSLFNARDEAVQAKGEAETACRAAESSAASAASSAERAEEVVSPVIGITSEIKIVSDNIAYVVTDSNNIDAIKVAAEAKNAIQTVASDFTGEIPSPNIHDFGVWGVDSIPSTRPTGGTISKVAEGIEDVQTTAENIEVVKALVAELPKAEDILEQVKGNASAAEAAQKAAVSARDAAKASETSAASSATNAAQSATASATAQGAAEAAQRAAEEALGAAQSAQGLAGSAASVAQQYATNAQTSASAAAQSENNAKGSADAAATSEKNAASSASAAAGSESAAKTSETNAKASETAAKNAQTAAESSKSAAASSASQAAQSATNAANSAASLSEAVQQASSSASAAAQSASAAQQSAQRAEEIADSLGDPLSKEEAAKTYATKTALTQGLGTKAPSNHSHTSDQITDLDQKFAEKLSPYATTETVNSGLSGKANAAHTHTMDQISDLSFDFGKWEAA